MSDPPSQSTEDAFDQWLVLRAQEGDEEALRRLVDRWSPRLLRHAMRLTGRADAAADVSQEAWLSIVRGLRKLDDPACFRRWAYQIVSRRCADWIRVKQRRREVADVPLEPAGPGDAAGEMADAVGELRVALKKLPDAERTVLAMHYLDDMRLQEIAEALLVPVGTVKSRMHHARQRLKRLLATREGQTGL